VIILTKVGTSCDNVIMNTGGRERTMEAFEKSSGTMKIKTAIMNAKMAMP
jgi:hypothetical protein